MNRNTEFVNTAGNIDLKKKCVKILRQLPIRTSLNLFWKCHTKEQLIYFISAFHLNGVLINIHKSNILLLLELKICLVG
jgi:hypothetical protein